MAASLQSFIGILWYPRLQPYFKPVETTEGIGLQVPNLWRQRVLGETETATAAVTVVVYPSLLDIQAVRVSRPWN